MKYRQQPKTRGVVRVCKGNSDRILWLKSHLRHRIIGNNSIHPGRNKRKGPTLAFALRGLEVEKEGMDAHVTWGDGTGWP